MYIRSIQLRNWKAYADATFDFPRPGKGKSVVLIGAKNGYGKTSLLEAILLCLYGREALDVLPRITGDRSTPEKETQTYDEFMERALHIQATQYGGDPSVSVSIVFEDEDSQMIRIVRKWFFSGAGKHQRGDEEITIYEGPEHDEELVHAPKVDDQDDCYRSYIAQNILPPSLAHFFFFDGEQIQRLAKRDQSLQVRDGIEGILGVKVLRTLQDDLRNYVQQKGRTAKGIGDEKLELLRAETQAIEIRLQANETEVTQLRPMLEPLRRRRDEIVKELRAVTGGSAASLDELHKKLNEDQRERDRYKERLERLLGGDLPLAIVGRSLRSSLYRRMEAEEERARWETSKVQSSDKLATISAALEHQTPLINPPLTNEQLAGLRERLRTAWESLWHPPPATCATEYRHPYLGPYERLAVRQRLDLVDRLARGELEDLLTRLGELETSIQKAKSRLSSLRGVGDKAKQMTDEMEKLNTREKEIDIKVHQLEREIVADKGLLANKRPALQKEIDQKQRSRPELAKVALAEKIAQLLDKAIEDAYPRHVEAIAHAMTEAYLAMAHKRQVHEIKIDPNLEVRLLGEKGRDIRNMDASAGEEQIFALSLVAAIASVVRFSVPVIMDTPLARLDTDHRLKVLDFFTAKASEQVILLSQPTEVHGQYLQKIRSRVCARFLVEHEELGDGLGLNHIRPDCYFEA